MRVRPMEQSTWTVQSRMPPLMSNPRRAAVWSARDEGMGELGDPGGGGAVNIVGMGARGEQGRERERIEVLRGNESRDAGIAVDGDDVEARTADGEPVPVRTALHERNAVADGDELGSDGADESALIEREEAERVLKAGDVR